MKERQNITNHAEYIKLNKTIRDKCKHANEDMVEIPRRQMLHLSSWHAEKKIKEIFGKKTISSKMTKRKKKKKNGGMIT